MARVGDVVLIPQLGDQHHVIIGQAPVGYWVQNLVTGALPTQTALGKREWSYKAGQWISPETIIGYRPKEMTVAGRALEWIKS